MTRLGTIREFYSFCGTFKGWDTFPTFSLNFWLIWPWKLRNYNNKKSFLSLHSYFSFFFVASSFHFLSISLSLSSFYYFFFPCKIKHLRVCQDRVASVFFSTEKPLKIFVTIACSIEIQRFWSSSACNQRRKLGCYSQ